MKITTEAAAVLAFDAARLRQSAEDARDLREFGVAQRLDAIVDVLEDAREYILNKPKQDKPGPYVMPESFIEFMLTAPVGSRLLFNSDHGHYYEKVNPTPYPTTVGWQRVYPDYYATNANGSIFGAEAFSEGEGESFTREVARG